MKKRISVLTLALALTFSASINLTAGTVMVGGKAWFAYWDSSIAQFFGEYMSDYFADAGIYNEVTVEPGIGYLAGPLVGYQTEDGKWSASGALMVINSFTQKTTMDASGEIVNVNSKLKRRDLDISVGYRLSEKLRLIVGYKWMYMRSDIEAEYAGTTYDFGWFEIASQMPGVGVGTVFPLTDKFFLSGQFGILYVKSVMQDDTGYKYDVDSSLGYNLEVAANFLVRENVLLQGGIRYQAFLLKVNDSASGVKIEKTDAFAGTTLSAIYMF